MHWAKLKSKGCKIKGEDREAGLLIRKTRPRTGTQIKQDSLGEMQVATMKIRFYKVNYVRLDL